MRLCCYVSRSFWVYPLSVPNLTLSLLLFLHLLLLCFYNGECLVLGLALCERCLAGCGAEGLLSLMPLLAWKTC